MITNKNSKLRKIIKEIIQEEYNFPFLIEGIDIDIINKVVSFNNNHENNVNTSININPIYSEINNIPVISIFKRVSNLEKTDGNPLIYALKGVNGWKFSNPKEDIIGLLKQFVRITEKINTDYDTIITVPSANVLNINFLHRLNKIIKADNKITDYFFKLDADDVWDNYIDWKGIKLEFGKRYEKAHAELLRNFRNMEAENNNIFSFKYIKNGDFRKYITKTMEGKSVDEQIKYAPFINGKNVLILDDTISTGSSISETTEEILNSFMPKSITVITLFSKL